MTDNAAALLLSRANLLFDVVWNSAVPAILVKRGTIVLTNDMASASASALDRAWSQYETLKKKQFETFKLKREEKENEMKEMKATKKAELKAALAAAGKDTETYSDDEEEDKEEVEQFLKQQQEKDLIKKFLGKEPTPPVLIIDSSSYLNKSKEGKVKKIKFKSEWSTVVIVIVIFYPLVPVLMCCMESQL